MTQKEKRIIQLARQAQAQGIDVEKALQDAMTTRNGLTAAIMATLKTLTPDRQRYVKECAQAIAKGLPFGYSPLPDKPTGLLNILDLNAMMIVSPFPMNPSSVLEWLDNNTPVHEKEN